MTTTANHTTCLCAWCNTWIKRGIMAHRMEGSKFRTQIKQISSRVGHANNLPVGPMLLIFSFLEQKDGIRTYCLDCATFEMTFSKSGRIVKAPMRFTNESFVTGSGTNKCDQYDRTYNGGTYCDAYESQKNSSYKLNNFIVSDDDEIILDDDISTSETSEESEEEEWDESDSETSEEEWSGDESD